MVKIVFFSKLIFYPNENTYSAIPKVVAFFLQKTPRFQKMWRFRFLVNYGSYRTKIGLVRCGTTWIVTTQILVDPLYSIRRLNRDFQKLWRFSKNVTTFGNLFFLRYGKWDQANFYGIRCGTVRLFFLAYFGSLWTIHIVEKPSFQKLWRFSKLLEISI